MAKITVAYAIKLEKGLNDVLKSIGYVSFFGRNGFKAGVFALSV